MYRAMRLMYFIWTLFERFGTNIVSLAGNIVLSYLLMPEDFGLVAMLGVFSSLIFVLVDCGMSDAVLTSGNPSNRDFNTLFYFNLAVGIALCAVYCALSPAVAWYFGKPEMQPMLCVLGVGAVFCAISISQMTKLRSRLQFRKTAVFNVCAISLALALAIVMALNGWRYWALIELNVGYSFFYWLMFALFTRWSLRWEFDTQRFRRFWKFGVNLLMSTIFTQVAQNIFAFVIGRHFNATQAGYLGQAQKMQQTPTNSLEGAISITSFVLISKEETPEDKSHSVLNMFGVFTFVNSAFCCLLLALSFPLIDFIFPDKWLPTIPYFRLLLCWALIYPVCNFMMVIFKVFDRTAVIRNVLIIEKVLIIVSAFLLYPLGIEAMIIAAIALSALTLLLYSFFASRITGIAATTFVGTLLFHVAMLATVGGITFAAATLSLPLGSLAAVLIGLVTYVITLGVATRLLRPAYFAYALDHLKRIGK